MINTLFVFSTRSLYRNEATLIDFSLLRLDRLEYVSSIVFHTVLLKMI